MKIRILCVGKVKEDFYRKRIKELSAQIQKRAGLEIIEVEDEKTIEGGSPAELQKIRELEGNRLKRYLTKEEGELRIALCIDGTKYSGEEWNHKIKQKINDSGIKQLTYVIGGSIGMDESVIRMADIRLSFSDMTFPHQLMRVLLLEQIAQADYL